MNHGRIPIEPRARRHGGARALAVFAMLALLVTGVALAPEAFAAKAEKGKASTKGAAPSKTKPAAPKHTGLETLEKQIQQFTLANGLQFVVVERHDAPVFSFATVVNSGAANDQIGTTGIAHMMEHMAFKGTEIVGTQDYAGEAALLAEEEKGWDALIAERRKGSKADSVRLASLDASFKNAQEKARDKVVANGFNT